MKRNMGTADRIIRAIIATIIFILLITGILAGAGAIILAVMAALFAFTSITAYCPLYAIFGLHTLPRDKRHRTYI